MNWTRATVIKILLLVARIMEDDQKVVDDIHALANHISYHHDVERMKEDQK